MASEPINFNYSICPESVSKPVCPYFLLFFDASYSYIYIYIIYIYKPVCFYEEYGGDFQYCRSIS